MKSKYFKINLIILFSLFFVNSTFADGGAGHSGISSLTWYFINFFVFFSFLIYIAKDKVSSFIGSRSEQFKNALNKGKLELDEAKEQLRQVNSRLEKLPQDLEALKFEYQNLLNGRISEIEKNTEKDLKRMEEQTNSMIEAEKIKMEKNLINILSEHVINQAREKLGATNETDRDRRRETFKAYAEIIK